MNLSLVIFDWNGTVLNDEAAAVSAFGRILHKLDHPEKANALAMHRMHFQVPVKKMYAAAGMDEKQYEQVHDVWETVYETEVDNAELQPGMAESFKLLHDKKVQIGVLSNYTVPAITAQIKKRGLNFEVVLANDDNHQAYTQGKQHRIEAYIGQENIDPTTILIIGDTVEEYEIAKAVGADSRILTNGWLEEDRLQAVPSSQRIHSKDLPQILESLL